MKILNREWYPEAMINFLLATQQLPSTKAIRISELWDAPLIKELALKHWDDIELDPHKCMPSLFGTAWHVAMETYGGVTNSLENRINKELDGTLITGQPDIVTKDAIEDHKTAAVYKYVMKDFDSWTKQLNSYAWLIGAKPRFLTVWAAFKDWSQMACLGNKDYPPRRLTKVSLPVWELGYTEQLIRDRIKVHLEVPTQECTAEERWQTNDVYALKKINRKSAVRVKDTEAELLSYMAAEGIKHDDPKYSIEKRPGVCKRCAEWCVVSEFCPYWQKRKEGALADADSNIDS